MISSYLKSLLKIYFHRQLIKLVLKTLKTMLFHFGNKTELPSTVFGHVTKCCLVSLVPDSKPYNTNTGLNLSTHTLLILDNESNAWKCVTLEQCSEIII